MDVRQLYLRQRLKEPLPIVVAAAAFTGSVILHDFRAIPAAMAGARVAAGICRKPLRMMDLLAR